MRRLLVVVAAAGLMTAASGAAPPPLKTLTQKTSYCLGLNIGRSIKQGGFEIDRDVLMRGVSDSLAGVKLALTDEEIRETMMAFQKGLQAKHGERRKTSADKNKTEGGAFLAANGAKEGIKTTASGLQYQVLREGKGPTPKASDTVVTHYRGTLLDGTEFDSSYGRGEPAKFPVNGVIPGWTEALQLMKVGAKWKLFVPSALAYGPRGAGRQIGPNATLVFEVELLEIK